ncbi:MAG: hypothetical protein J7M19_08840 [Planctomycetes bacterium]|nr:hypothetical protein [Planctomycetota bacterium]
MFKTYIRLLKVVLLGCCLVPVTNAVCTLVDIIASGAEWSLPVTAGKIAAVTVLFVLPAAVFWRLLRGFEPALEANAREQASFLEGIPDRYLDLAIFGSAALGLFLELVIIRWQSTVFQVFAFYKNFSLLACFAGLGIGYALSRRKHIPLIFTVPMLFVHIVLLTVMRYGLGWRMESVKATPIVEQLNMGLKNAATLPDFVALYLFLGTTFAFTALAFVPVGQVCGRLMERRAKLRAYGWNLLGSVFGVALVMALSFLWLPPVVWFGVAFAAILVFQAFRRRALLFGAAVSIAALTALAWPVAFPSHRIYSPYQLIERSAGENGLMEIRAAGLYHQRVFDLAADNSNRRTNPHTKRVADYYEFPYRLQPNLERVAVVGSGTGNDVAAALRMGAAYVDAIEIDPAILALGKRFHPEKPYADPRTHSVINDARTFLRTTPERYDMIVYGLLDSHTLLSHASSVRLDSFVYTVEAFREARARLADGGMMSLSFCVLSPELGRKIYLMMEDAFGGRAPVCVRADYDSSVIFLQQRGGDVVVPKALLASAGFTDVTTKYADRSIETVVSTDDWPFFYMPRRVYPVSYIGMAVLVVLLSVGLTRLFVSHRFEMGHSAFFFLGAGFMLIETKAITEMGLTFGNTWHVIGIVIVGILVMAFLANCFVRWRKIENPTVPYLLLFASLTAGLWVARHGGFSSTAAGRIATVLVLVCPMFFSGIVFSTLLSKAENISGVMAVNLIGSMLGGILEYNSMYFGFQFLYLLGLALYGMALVSSLKRAPVVAPAPA